MARRRAKLDLTLFPFMSVLCGLIAVMVLLMMVTVGTRVMTPEVAGAAEAPGPVVEEGVDAATYTRLEAQVVQLEGVLTQQRRKREEVHLQVMYLDKLLKDKQDEYKQARDKVAKPGGRLGAPSPLNMIPLSRPGATQKKPVYIEVDSDRYVTHPDRKPYPFSFKKGSSGAEVVVPTALAQRLKEVADAGKEYPLLLVKPNGAMAFDALLTHLQLKHEKLEVGWESFEDKWVLIPKAK